MDRFRISTFAGKMELSIADVRRPPGMPAQARVAACLEQLAAEVDRQHDDAVSSRLVPLHFDSQWEKILRAVDCMVHVLQDAAGAFEFRRKTPGTESHGRATTTTIAMAPVLAGSSYRLIVQLLIDVTVKRCVDGPNLLHQRCIEVMRDYLAVHAYPDIFGAATADYFASGGAGAPTMAAGSAGGGAGAAGAPPPAAAAAAAGAAGAAASSSTIIAPAAPPSFTDEMFSKLVSWWRRHKIFAELMRQLFSTVDRNAVSGHPGKWSLSAVAAKAWSDVIFRQAEVQCRLRILRAIGRCRATGTLRSEEPLEELTEMFKVAALCAAASASRSLSSLAGGSTVGGGAGPPAGGQQQQQQQHHHQQQQQQRLRQWAQQPAGAGGDHVGTAVSTALEGFHQVQYLVDPTAASRQHCFVVPNQLPLLPVRGLYVFFIQRYCCCCHLLFVMYCYCEQRPLVRVCAGAENH